MNNLFKDKIFIYTPPDKHEKHHGSILQLLPPKIAVYVNKYRKEEDFKSHILRNPISVQIPGYYIALTFSAVMDDDADVSPEYLKKTMAEMAEYYLQNRVLPKKESFNQARIK